MIDLEKLTDPELKLIHNGLKELRTPINKEYGNTLLKLIDDTREEIRKRGIEKNYVEVDYTYTPDDVNIGKVQGASGKWMK